jgi:hypothetical protein
MFLTSSWSIYTMNLEGYRGVNAQCGHAIWLAPNILETMIFKCPTERYSKEYHSKDALNKHIRKHNESKNRFPTGIPRPH